MDNNNKMFALIINDNAVGFVVKGVVKTLVTSLVNALPETFKVETREVPIQDLSGYKVIVVGESEKPAPAEPAVNNPDGIEEKPAE